MHKSKKIIKSSKMIFEHKSKQGNVKQYDGSKKQAHSDDVTEQNGLTVVEGRNAVAEILKAGREIDKLYVSKEARGTALSQIISDARKVGVPISYCDKRKLSLLSSTGAHQGIIAVAAAHSYAELDVLLADLKKSVAPMLVICDGITDPRNLGAIIRSAEIFGANGVIITKHSSAGLNSACANAAAGALEYVPVVRCSSLIRTIDLLKKQGLWIIGMGIEGQTSVYDAKFELPCAIVIGSEGKGISKGVANGCDFMVKIPMKGKINSLNASAAAAIALCEAVRKRENLA